MLSPKNIQSVTECDKKNAEFINFLKEYSVITTAVAAIFSYKLNDLTNEFFDGIILPIINRDADKKNRFENKEYNINGIKFKLGKFTLSIVKFIIIIYILYILASIFKYHTS
jgi:large-conductance mechanosensitive channel